jgi:hypothetical protein
MSFPGVAQTWLEFARRTGPRLACQGWPYPGQLWATACQGWNRPVIAYPAQGWHREGVVPPLAQSWHGWHREGVVPPLCQTPTPGPRLAQSWPGWANPSQCQPPLGEWLGVGGERPNVLNLLAYGLPFLLIRSF